MFRDRPGRLLGGVCAALAVHFRWDPVAVRVAFLALAFVSGGMASWVYGGLWALLPFEPGGRAPAFRAWDAVGRWFSSPPKTTF